MLRKLLPARLDLRGLQDFCHPPLYHQGCLHSNRRQDRTFSVCFPCQPATSLGGFPVRSFVKPRVPLFFESIESGRHMENVHFAYFRFFPFFWNQQGKELKFQSQKGRAHTFSVIFYLFLATVCFVWCNKGQTGDPLSVIISFQFLCLFKLYGRGAVFCMKLTLGLSLQGFYHKRDARNLVVNTVK